MTAAAWLVAAIVALYFAIEGSAWVSFVVILVVVVPTAIVQQREHYRRAEHARGELRSGLDLMSPAERLNELSLYEQRFGSLPKASRELRAEIEQVNGGDRS
ncbi:MAG: hypothetical protein HZB14_09385 [Actinobacteria bacterium]|nr:hypothetical protein [Actinomycetota bacterium]